MSRSRVPAMMGWLLFFGGLAAVGYFAFGRRDVEPVIPEGNYADLVEDAERYLRQRRYDAALDVAKEALEAKEDSPRALILAGRASGMLGDYPGSLGYYSRVPTDGSEDSIAAAFEKASIEHQYRTYSNAEKDLLSVLERDPDHVEANRLMGEIMDLSGRRWEAVPYALEVVRQTMAGLETLLRLADQENMDGRVKKILAVNARDKRDPAPRLGLSRTALWEGQPKASRILTESVIKDRPALMEAHVRLGALLLDAGEYSEFVKWHESLPEGAEFHPDLWVLRGRWARLENQNEAAARCFWEATRRNPNEGPGMKALGQLLIQLGREEEATPFLERAALLTELRTLINLVLKGGETPPVVIIKQIPDLLTKLGRTREAGAWNALLTGQRATADAATRATTPEEVLALWVPADFQPALSIDLSGLPLPDFDKELRSVTGLSPQLMQYQAQFEDMADTVGLNFTFVAAPDESTEGKRIIELTGGGLGAIDIDMDSWPDLFFTQGGLYPAAADGPTDRLFRNTGAGFEDITELVGIDNAEFGQGLSVADFNSDGFPDLYIGNNGRNKLYVNNGDGTMTDVSDSLGDTRVDWTTSAAMVDANGDGLPDIFVVNYVTGDVYELICEANGRPTICGPDVFESVQDRFFLNMGDGTFADKTEESGLVGNSVTDLGKGLGILVADFEENGELQFFVANDGVPNFMYSKPQSDQAFLDISLPSGVATSGDGVSQGCMGIASADVNGDDQLDFFVTNFEGEFNTLYLRSGPGAFEDRTKQAKLHDASYRFVGFGTQFVDGELDGAPDVLLTNGHVADFVTGTQQESVPANAAKKRRAAKTTYRMPCQYFRNDTTGTFGEQFSENVGDFFDKEFLGRSMARLDWNKDGRDDVGISYLDTPVSLLTNTSEKTGHYLAIRFVGTRTSRDAIGTTVRLRDGEWRRMQQLTGGDGYQCSNEKRLVFGLADRTTIPKLEVRWLDGSKQTFENVSADQEYILVQGESELRAVPR